jgi:hypothetical protein
VLFRGFFFADEQYNKLDRFVKEVEKMAEAIKEELE